MSAEVVDAINTEVGNVRSVLESGSAEEIKSKVSDLQKALMKIGEHLAGQSQAGSTEGNEGASGTYDTDVKDGRKDEEKK